MLCFSPYLILITFYVSFQRCWKFVFDIPLHLSIRTIFQLSKLFGSHSSIILGYWQGISQWRFPFEWTRMLWELPSMLLFGLYWAGYCKWPDRTCCDMRPWAIDSSNLVQRFLQNLNGFVLLVRVLSLTSQLFEILRLSLIWFWRW